MKVSDLLCNDEQAMFNMSKEDADPANSLSEKMKISNLLCSEEQAISDVSKEDTDSANLLSKNNSSVPTDEKSPRDERSEVLVRNRPETSAQSENDHWTNRYYDFQRWGAEFLQNPRLKVDCSLGSRRQVGNLSQNTWGVWLGPYGDNAAGPFTSHYPSGSIQTHDDFNEEDSHLVGTITAAIEALSILRKEIKEAKRARVHIDQIVIVADSEILTDYICGIMPIEAIRSTSLELSQAVEKLNSKVELLEKSGIEVLFHIVEYGLNQHARTLAGMEADRILYTVDIVSSTKVKLPNNMNNNWLV
ncbi:hypothetical protein GLAREA_03098 [Glarea lozoyensis ATCC 20868]|uniref:Uncharacterized protein n=1 Tax=Glarea lozoyensis (strain ATCC 20868 / MF5171) TaxID=1116229 RepID=S3CPX3_GLAL2|nr:uncharacterized protein GLAREA_03098 [Glarea lozoyensis ATCC 20868]EPE27184.1 hypothetical protein GLAREA_03098 [Glarea lozoyensis ATCC 20868]